MIDHWPRRVDRRHMCSSIWIVDNNHQEIYWLTVGSNKWFLIITGFFLYQQLQSRIVNWEHLTLATVVRDLMNRLDQMKGSFKISISEVHAGVVFGHLSLILSIWHNNHTEN